MANIPNTNSGHEHVWERPDGVKARCGGPTLCTECRDDAAKALIARGPQNQPPEEKLYRAIADYKVVLADESEAEMEVTLDDILEVGDLVQLIERFIGYASCDVRLDEVEKAIDTYQKQKPDRDGVLWSVINDLGKRKLVIEAEKRRYE